MQTGLCEKHPLLDGIIIACMMAALEAEKSSNKKTMLRGRLQQCSDVQTERYFMAAINLRRSQKIELLDTIRVPKRTSGAGKEDLTLCDVGVPKPFCAHEGELLQSNIEIAASFMRRVDERLSPMCFFMDETPLLSRFELGVLDGTYKIRGGTWPSHATLPTDAQLDEKDLAKLTFDVLAKRPDTTSTLTVSSFPMKSGGCTQDFVRGCVHNVLQVAWKRGRVCNYNLCKCV